MTYNHEFQINLQLEQRVMDTHIPLARGKTQKEGGLSENRDHPSRNERRPSRIFGFDQRRNAGVDQPGSPETAFQQSGR